MGTIVLGEGIVLQDTKLDNNTLIRVTLVDNQFEISVIKDGILSAIRLPDTTEAAFELLQIAYKLLHRNLQRDLGKVAVTE